jgi:hypothetical protein
VLDVEDAFAAAGSRGRVPLAEVLHIGVGGADLDRRCGSGTGGMGNKRGGDEDSRRNDGEFHSDLLECG